MIVFDYKIPSIKNFSPLIYYDLSTLLQQEGNSDLCHYCVVIPTNEINTIIN